MRDKLKVLDLFSGIGGFSLGLERTGGFETTAFCEIDPFCQQVLKRHWPGVFVYDDVETLTADRLFQNSRELPDVICGGFPCQDISHVGSGEGIEGARSGLWKDFARLIGDIRPEFAIVENVAALLDRDLGFVLRDLADLRYDAEWSIVPMCAVGAPHMRQRVFIVAYPNSVDGRPRVWDTASVSDWALQTERRLAGARAGWRTRLANPSELYRGADGLPNGMERNRAIGNSVSPDVIELIGNAILASLNQSEAA